MNYNHTQKSYLLRVISLLVSILFGLIMVKAGFNLLLLFLMLAIIFIIFSFSSLTVTVDEENLRLKYGFGIFAKRISLSEISASSVVKNHWYYGWGIRYWPWRRIWIYNVSGLDAVELTLISGKIIRIGTDEPLQLSRVLKKPQVSNNIFSSR